MVSALVPLLPGVIFDVPCNLSVLQLLHMKKTKKTTKKKIKFVVVLASMWFVRTQLLMYVCMLGQHLERTLLLSNTRRRTYQHMGLGCLGDTPPWVSQCGEQGQEGRRCLVSGIIVKSHISAPGGGWTVTRA